VGLAAVGCSPGFEDPSTLRDLRLLAVTAEPAEVLVDFAAPPATLPTIMLGALVVQPDGGPRPVPFSARACGNDPAGGGDRGRATGPGSEGDTIALAACPAGSPVVDEGAAMMDPDGSASVPIAFSPTPDLLVEAARADPQSAILGLPLRVSLDIDGGAVVGLKRVVFSPRLDPDQLPNRNPALTMLTWRAHRDEPPAPLTADLPPTVFLGSGLLIAPDRAEVDAEAEPYRAQAISRLDGQVTVEEIPHETLRYSFYATRGTFAPPSVSTEPSPLLENPNTTLETVYHAPAALPPGDPGDVDVYVVVRDERGGCSWARRKLKLLAR
jgi:hypothetical protein